MRWNDFKKANEPVEACKMIMSDYLELGSFKELEKKYETKYVTIRSFLDSNYQRFDKEAKMLDSKMRAHKKNNVSKNLKKARETNHPMEKVKKAKTNQQTKDSGIKQNKKFSVVENNHLSILDTLPRVIRYYKFLGIISKVNIHTLTTNEWLKEAEKRGIKVI